MDSKERPDWDTYFMNIAYEVAKRSPDPRKKVGAVIVDDLNRIISTGYNALPSKFPENSVDWEDREFIHSIIIHAECNALLYCLSRFKNSKLYCTLSPCPECIKLIKSCCISQIYFKEKYKKYDVFIMDDIQFLSKKEKTQEELFHLFNMMKDNNKHIV